MKQMYGSPRYRTKHWSRPLLNAIVRLRLIWIILLAVLCLSGCVRYDSEIKFYSPRRGEVIQQIHLGESLTAFNRKPIQEWLTKLDRQARQLQGRTQRLDDRTLTITLPFFNGADLERKFNQLLSLAIESSFTAIGQPEMTKPEAHLRLIQNNFLLLQRNHLIYDVDLSSIGLSGTEALAEDNGLLQLEFTLNTPWTPHSGTHGFVADSPDSHRLTWSLKAGQQNHLEAFFWLPDPLGIGTVIIILLVMGGAYIKMRTRNSSELVAASPSSSQNQ